MISKIDIIYSHLTSICKEILDAINHRKTTDDIFELVVNCYAENKEQISLEGIWLDRNSSSFPNSFIIEFFFKNVDECFAVWFSQLNSFYYARLDNHIIITTPPSKSLEGPMYCSPHQRILYVDYFTTWLPLEKEDKLLTAQDIFNWQRKDIDVDAKEKFNYFYDRLSEGEKNELKIANIDFWDFDNKKGENCTYILNRIQDETISSVVTSDYHALIQLKSLLPADVPLYYYEERVPLLTKRQWVFRAVSQIKMKLEYEQYNPRIISYRDWCNKLKGHYNIPNSLMREALINIVGDVYDKL